MIEEIGEKVRQLLQLKISMLQHDSKFRFIYDWNDVRQVVDSLIPTITWLVNQERAERRKVQGRLNMLTFGCDPERNKQIIELKKTGVTYSSYS